jgi:hypothetical protein
MKRCILVLVYFVLLNFLSAQSLYVPPVNGNEWETAAPDSLNWCEESIDSLYGFWNYKVQSLLSYLKTERSYWKDTLALFLRIVVGYGFLLVKASALYLLALLRKKAFSISMTIRLSIWEGDGPALHSLRKIQSPSGISSP